MDIIKEKKELFEKSIEHLKVELSKIRSGRANPELVDSLLVDYYGTKTPLKQLANINTPDARSILITPFDKSSVKNIESAIQSSDLGFNPVNEGEVIRIPIPPLTEERRQELVKMANEKIEQGRVSLRNIREEIWKTLKDKKSEGKITEDDLFSYQKELQKTLDDYNEKVKEMAQAKEKEIMSI